MPSITMNLSQMDRELDRLGSCISLSEPAALSCKHAAELLRAFRATFDISWRQNTSDLHKLASAPTVWLLKTSTPDGDNAEPYGCQDSAVAAAKRCIEEYSNHSVWAEHVPDLLKAFANSNNCHVEIGEDYVTVEPAQVR